MRILAGRVPRGYHAAGHTLPGKGTNAQTSSVAQGLVSKDKDSALLSLILSADEVKRRVTRALPPGGSPAPHCHLSVPTCTQAALLSDDATAQFHQLRPAVRLAVTLAALLLRGSRSK